MKFFSDALSCNSSRDLTFSLTFKKIFERFITCSRWNREERTLSMTNGETLWRIEWNGRCVTKWCVRTVNGEEKQNEREIVAKRLCGCGWIDDSTRSHKHTKLLWCISRELLRSLSPTASSSTSNSSSTNDWSFCVLVTEQRSKNKMQSLWFDRKAVTLANSVEDEAKHKSRRITTIFHVFFFP